MADFLRVAGGVLCNLFIAVLAVLVWKTGEYFNRIPDADRSKPLLAWDLLMLITVLFYFVFKIILK